MTDLELTNVLQATFPSLSKEDCKAFLGISLFKNYTKKEVIIKAKTINDTIIFLIEGMIRGFFINENGQEKNIFLRPERTITGAPECLIENKPTKYSFEIMSGSICLLTKKSNFQRLLHSHPNLQTLWIEGLQENILTLIGRVESLIDKNPEKRYEDLLKQSPVFFQKAYNKHIANYLGITSVSLSRIIKRKMEGNSKI